MSRDGLLKMSELADASGVSAGTIKHYLREGLLGEADGVVRTSRYTCAMEALVAEEVAVVLERLAGELEADRVVELLEAGIEPLRDFIAALHSKLLVEQLQRQRERR